MSNPIDTTKVGKYQAIQSALCELVSAESSCNMYPDPIPEDPTVDVHSLVVGEPELRRYISECDANVKHAIEHMHAAFRLMNMAHHDQESLKTQVYKLCVQIEQLGAKPCIETWLDLCSRCNTNNVADAFFCDTCTAELSHRKEEP